MLDKEDIIKANLILIENYYNRALTYIQSDDYRSAMYLLYNIMPQELYDLSLDVMDNRNLANKRQGLKELIVTVDNLLNREVDELDINNIDLPIF